MAFYWYQSDPDLYRAEVQAMNKFFPSFTIHQLPDAVSYTHLTLPTIA